MCLDLCREAFLPPPPFSEKRYHSMEHRTSSGLFSIAWHSEIGGYISVIAGSDLHQERFSFRNTFCSTTTSTTTTTTPSPPVLRTTLPPSTSTITYKTKVMMYQHLNPIPQLQLSTTDCLNRHHHSPNNAHARGQFWIHLPSLIFSSMLYTNIDTKSPSLRRLLCFSIHFIYPSIYDHEYGVPRAGKGRGGGEQKRALGRYLLRHNFS